MSELFDTLYEVFDSTSKVVVDKAKSTSSIAKLKMEKKSKENFIEKQYASIGKKVFETEKDNDETAFEEIFLIKQTQEELESIQKELMHLKGLVKCPNCGSEISPTVRYCPNCGKDTKKTAETVDEESES